MKKWVILLLGFLLGIALQVPAWAQIKINGLEARKGRDLTSDVARHSAEVTSLNKSYQALQAKLAATSDTQAKARLQQQIDQSGKRLAAAQKASGNASAALSDWQAKVLATHKAKSGATINWKSATISGQ